MWVDNYEQDSIKYKLIEHYKNDISVKKWKTYIDGKSYKTEKYKNGICTVKNYYQNGKLKSKGKTRIEINSIETHWFYSGDWKFYSDKGKLINIRKYNNGELIQNKKLNKKIISCKKSAPNGKRIIKLKKN